jgi:phosphatidylserine/phosphatidylglycerophosphate/cardiolipin synthase-like enzyme
MPAVFTPVVSAGTAMEVIAPSAPAPAGRYANDPLRWVGVGAGTSLYAFATGVVTAVASGPSNGLPGKPGSPWTLVEFSPLPQPAPDVFRTLAGGLPLLLILIEGSGAPVAMNDFLLPASLVATAPPGIGNTAFFVVAFQDRVCRDPLSWAEALAATNATSSDFRDFVNAIAALPGARKIFVADHVGRPLTTGKVSIAIDMNPAITVEFPPNTDGDTGLTLPAGSHAVIGFVSSHNPIVAGVGAPLGSFGVPVALGQDNHLAQLLDVDAWLAQRDDGIVLPAWHPGSRLKPLVDGNAYFADLASELLQLGGGHNAGKGIVELAGWAFVKGSLADSSIEWPLVPGQDQGDNDTRLLSLVKNLKAKGVAMRFLVNQFLQFDSPNIDDFPELNLLLLALWSALGPAQALFQKMTDPAGYILGLGAAVIVYGILSSDLGEDVLSDLLEYSRETVKALQAIDPGLAIWTPYPAAFADNPLLPVPFKVLGHKIDDFSHIGTYHQKFINIRRTDNSHVSWLGGMDISNDRVDAPMHRALHPFHDVQVKIEGPAVTALISTFDDRARDHGSLGLIAQSDAVDHADAAQKGNHLIQIARTYYRPAPGSSSRPISAAKNGESTAVRTLIKAFRSAVDYIYIEDQYFTPPDDYVQELLNAGYRGVKALLITVPYQNDQPFGGLRRTSIFDALSKAWKDRLNIGNLFRRFMHRTPALITNLGRMSLTFPLGASDSQMTVSPTVHLPPPPFWCFVENELVLVTNTAGAPGGDAQTLNIVRGGGWGANPVKHAIRAPVLCVQVPPIYVHAKVTIVDDIFLFAGSSNMNRRGTYHDGEIDSCTISEFLKSDPDNPARLLRCRLWAEHLGISPEAGISLLADPQSAIALFKARNWYKGGHRQPLSFIYAGTPPVASIGLSTNFFAQLIEAGAAAIDQTVLKADIWPIADPTSGIEPAPRAPGPSYP